MSDSTEQQNNPAWLSTYAQVTAASVLGGFQIYLPHEELCKTLQEPESPYHYLLTIPSKNIFNGIVCKQGQDYQAYAQKLFIDYKLTVIKIEDETEQETDHADSAIEMKYHELVQLGELFEEKRLEHKKLIAKSQIWLIQQTEEGVFEVNSDQSSQINEFGAQVENNLLAFQSFNQKFRGLIIETTALLSVMSDYTIDPEKMAENKTSLDFDPAITGEQAEAQVEPQAGM